LGGANITGSLNMSSTQGTVSFGQATVTGNLIADTQGQQVDLGSANVGGNLLVQTQGGNVVQTTTANSALRIAGSSTLNTGTGNVTLPNVPNQFVGPVSMQANDVQLVGSNGLILGNSTITGQLSVTAVTGSVTQSPNALLNVSGQSLFSATQGDVMLNNANTLTQTVSVQAVNASLRTTSALNLGASTVTGDLALKVDAGDVTQTAALQVTGLSNIVAATGNITLTDTANRFVDRVSVKTPQALKLTATGALSMGEVDVGGTSQLQSQGVLDLGTNANYTGKLTAKSGGFDIIQSGPLKAGAAVDFDAGSAKIDLFNPKNLWLGALYFKGGIIMINHPQLMNATNSGSLMVRVETTLPMTPVASVRVSAKPSIEPAPASSAKGSGNADVTVSVARAASANQSGLVRVAVSPEVATAGKGFAFSLAEHLPADVPKEAPARVSQVDGRPLPEWLKFEAGTQKFVANEVPPGAFPIQIKVSVGGTDTVIVVTEQPK
jgi:hypothetical protein